VSWHDASVDLAINSEKARGLEVPGLAARRADKVIE